MPIAKHAKTRLVKATEVCLRHYELGTFFKLKSAEVHGGTAGRIFLGNGKNVIAKPTKVVPRRA